MERALPSFVVPSVPRPDRCPLGGEYSPSFGPANGRFSSIPNGQRGVRPLRQRSFHRRRPPSRERRRACACRLVWCPGDVAPPKGCQSPPWPSWFRRLAQSGDPEAVCSKVRDWGPDQVRTRGSHHRYGRRPGVTRRRSSWPYLASVERRRCSLPRKRLRSLGCSRRGFCQAP